MKEDEEGLITNSPDDDSIPRSTDSPIENGGKNDFISSPDHGIPSKEQTAIERNFLNRFEKLTGPFDKVKENTKKLLRRSAFHKTVNWFLGIMIFIFAVFIILLGFSQTSTFRNFVRQKLVAILNEETKGHFSIGQIDGSFFTALTIRDVALTYSSDTIGKFTKISIRLNPMALLIKTISITDISVHYPYAALETDSTGTLNFARVFPSKEKPDTAPSSFPYKIDVGNFEIVSGKFNVYDWRYRDSLVPNQILNIENLRLDSFHLKLKAQIDIDNKDFKVDIKNLEAKTNLKNIHNIVFSSDIRLNRKTIEVNNLSINTLHTEIKASLKTDGLDIFSGITREKLKQTKVSLKLELPKFSFDELTAFVPAVDMLKGDLRGELMAEGFINKLSIRKLFVEYGETSLLVQGRFENLDNPKELLIFADMTKSKLVPENISRLLPAVTLPELKGFESIQIDSLSFSGKPLTFKTKSKLSVSGGILRSDAILDFSGSSMKYSASLYSDNINLGGVAHYPINFNGAVSISGQGFDPKTAELICKLNGDNSIIGNKHFNKLNLNASLANGDLVTDLNALTSRDSLSFIGNLNFINDTLPEYSGKLNLSGFNLAPLLMDSALSSKINLSLDLTAKGFNPDDISGIFNLDINNSLINANLLDSLHAALTITRGQNYYHRFSLLSDVADLEIKGNFPVIGFANSVRTQTNLISSAIANKLSTYFPKLFSSDTSKSTIKLDSAAKTSAPYDVEASLKIKDTKTINTFIPNLKVDFDGEILTKFSQTGTDFHFDLMSEIKLLKMEFKESVYYIYDGSCTAKINADTKLRDISEVSADIDFSATRFLVNQELQDVAVNLSIERGIAKIGCEVSMLDKMRTTFDGSFNLTEDILDLRCKKLVFKYYRFEIKNQKPFSIAYIDDNFAITGLELKRGDSKMTVEGNISASKTENLKITLSNLKGYDLSYSLLGTSPSDIIDSDINVTMLLSGTFKQPLISLTLDADSVTYKSTNFGSLKGQFNYANEQIVSNIKFIDRANKDKKERFSLIGTVPINLSLTDVKNRIPAISSIDLHVAADNFNLTSVSNFFPAVTHLRGFLNGKIDLAGTYTKPEPTGFMRLTNVGFRAVQNNLDYSAGSLFTFNKATVKIDSFIIRNEGKVKNKGTITGNGTIVATADSGFALNANIHGDLTILSDASKVTNSSIYGNLFIGTDGDMVFSYSKGKTFLSVPLVVKEAKVVFPSTQSGYSAAGDNFIYRKPVTEFSLSPRELEMRRLSNLYNRKTTIDTAKSITGKFDYEIKVRIKDEANFVFVFNQEANQKLNAVLKGDVVFERKNGIQNFQGELTVLDGSTLEFVKTFSATGSIRFENDLTNPNLNIIGLYKAYYQKVDTTSVSGGRDEEVAIKVRLKGPLRDMAKNFSQDENNIAVYVGASNIEKEVVSQELDKADAVWFIITGKFKRDLTQQDKTRAANQVDPISGTATSLAGSLVGGLLNNYFGDYVKSIELRNNGTSTKFNLSGKFKSFRYTFGGSTNFLQDISTASVRIEYPFFENLLIRIERRESVTETSYQNQMISEMGLRYRIEF